MLLGERGRSPGNRRARTNDKRLKESDVPDDYGSYADRFDTAARTSGVRGVLRGR
jgi:hypothetical protein